MSKRQASGAAFFAVLKTSLFKPKIGKICAKKYFKIFLKNFVKIVDIKKTMCYSIQALPKRARTLTGK